MSATGSRRWTCRSLHATLAVVSIVPILVTVASGALYRFCRGVLHWEKASCNVLLSLHTLSFLRLHTVYPILVAILSVALLLTSLPLRPLSSLLTSPSLASLRAVLLPDTLTRRTLHRTLTLLIAGPFLITALTGLVWTVFRHYLGATKEEAAPMMGFHQGGYTGLSPVLYTAVLGVLSFVAFVPGLMLTSAWRAAFPATRRKPA